MNSRIGQEVEQVYPHKMKNCVWAQSDICESTNYTESIIFIIIVAV